MCAYVYLCVYMFACYCMLVYVFVYVWCACVGASESAWRTSMCGFIHTKMHACVRVSTCAIARVLRSCVCVSILYLCESVYVCVCGCVLKRFALALVGAISPPEDLAWIPVAGLMSETGFCAYVCVLRCLCM